MDLPPQPADGSRDDSWPQPATHLLNGATVSEYREALSAAIDAVAARVVGTDRPFTGVSPDDLAAAISAVELDEPLSSTKAALDELDQLYLRDAVWFHHPRYFAHLNCPVVIPAVVAEAVSAVVNSSLDTWDQSAGATLMEQRLIEWTGQLLGLGEQADGVFTSGGTQSNLHGLFLAREAACERLRPTEGPERRTCELLPRLRILTSECAHFSVAKSAALLGLGWDAVVAVRCGPDRRMQVLDLVRQLRRCRRDGLVPMAVVATAGTTDFGSIDPLGPIAEACATAGVWLHVDAAYGCGLLVSRRRTLLAGIERADSVTVDFHKSFFQPVPASAIVVRETATLDHGTYHADYLNPARSAAQGVPNQVDKSLQTSRRFDALKLWLTLRVMGPQAIGALFDAIVDLAARTGHRLQQDPRFQLVAQPQLSTLVFRYAPADGTDPRLADEANRHARDAVAQAGEAVVGGTVVDGRDHLKLTLLNPGTDDDDLAQVLDRIAAHARHHVDAGVTRVAPAGRSGLADRSSGGEAASPARHTG